ncbi:MAG: FAD-dependent oxidoreductase [Cyclobacteriaceae bacterium]
MNKTVVIIGGGVAGMSAAHELVERGFKVKVFEKEQVYVGGKARSVDVPGSAAEPQKPLPGEHGFRFFPGFYRHITDTMKRIPFEKNKNGVFDNLVATQRVMMARFGKPPLVNIVNFPKSLNDLIVAINAIVDSDTGLTKKDAEFFGEKLWQLMTSCYDRRSSDYERIGWWQFMDADHQSTAFNQYFVGGITRTLVAAKPKEVSTKTGGDILLQLLFLMGTPDANSDRVLNGPTNDVWLYPWRDYLIKKGVEYFHDHSATKINVQDSKITSVDFEYQGKTVNASGDYYISAVPVEVMSKLLTPELIQLDLTLNYISTLAPDVSWMTGIQFYLNEDVDIVKGHVMYTDSPWALTSISQLQFWKNFDVSKYGNGKVKGILSVDVSDWDTPGLNGKMAKDCTKEEIKDEIWSQLTNSLMVNGKSMLDPKMIEAWYLDRDIVFGHSFKTMNKEPLLVNKVNTWPLRPEAYTGIPNFFLASDYVRTYTDLATMEGANEAARRAVNAIIQTSGSDKELCKIWNLHEPDILAVNRWYDQIRFKKGLPWKKEVPFFVEILHLLNHFFRKIF